MKRNLLTIMLAFLVVFGVNAQKKNVKSIDKTPYSSSSAINATKAQWDILFTFNDLVAGSPGIETDGTNFYTTLWSGSDFHKYDMDGSNGTTFTVAGVSNVRDMAYDGQYFYGAAADMNLYQMDLANETLISTITATCTGVTGIRHIAYDPTLDGGNGGFWIGNWTELGAIAMDGSELVAGGSITLESCYGSAYDNWSDPSNPKLWLFQQPTGAEAIFYEFDINTMAMTGVTHDASDAPGYSSGGLSGGACTYEADGKFILVGNIQQDPCLAVAYELAVTAAPTAPNVATDYTAIADASGALTVDLAWTNPAIDVNGDPLAQLNMVEVYIDGAAVAAYTVAAPVIGASETYTATVAAGGNHTFTVVGTNDAGKGIPTSLTAFVGVDVEVTSINLPAYAVLDETVAPAVVVTNNGAGAQSFDVTLTDGTYSEVMSVTDLASGASQELTFPDWSSATAGTFTFTATASDPGSDIDLANNTLNNDLSVFSGCAHTLVLTDDYGDGWNGNTASVSVNGDVVLDHITVAADEDTFTFFAENGDDIQFDFWGEGSYISEVSWLMTDGLGNTLLEVAAGDVSDALTENVVGLCTAVATYAVTFTVTDGTNPIEGATVSVTTAAKVDVVTDASGNAVFNLAAGSYDYTVTKTGYNTFTSTTPVVVVDAAIAVDPVVLVVETGINELANAISVYPNPSNGVFTVSVNDNFNLEVIDVTGRVINSLNVNSNSTLNISEAGVYFLRFSNENGTTVKRVVVK